MENRAIGEMTMGEEGRRWGKGGKRKDRGARKKEGSMRGMERGAGGYLFCLAPLLNTQLPLLKETEQRALYLGVRVWPAYQRGPCSTLYQWHQHVKGFTFTKSSLSLSSCSCVTFCVCVCACYTFTRRPSEQLAADKGVHNSLFQKMRVWVCVSVWTVVGAEREQGCFGWVGSMCVCVCVDVGWGQWLNVLLWKPTGVDWNPHY